MTLRPFERLMRAAGKASAAAIRTATADTETVAVSLSAIELGALDVWIADQPEPRPSRAEAIRQMVAERFVR